MSETDACKEANLQRCQTANQLMTNTGQELVIIIIILIASIIIIIIIMIIIMLSNWPRAGHQDKRISEGFA